MRALDDTTYSILVCKGVTRGDPLTMVAYGLGVLLLIQDHQEAFPDIHQPWYVDDAANGRRLNRIRKF